MHSSKEAVYTVGKYTDLARFSLSLKNGVGTIEHPVLNYVLSSIVCHSQNLETT